MSARPLLLGLLALAAFAALSGCAGSLFKTSGVPPEVYELAAPPAAAPTPAAAPALTPPAGLPAEGGPAAMASGPAGATIDLAVHKPRVRIGLDDDLIAVLYPDRRLDHLAHARWSGPLDEMLQDLILETFRARTSAVVAAHADTSAFGSRYWLEVDVDDFQAEYGSGDAPPVIHVHAAARLGGASDRQILGRFDLEARAPASANRVGAIVEAYNRAVDDVLTDLVNRTLASLAPAGT